MTFMPFYGEVYIVLFESFFPVTSLMSFWLYRRSSG